MEKKNCTQRAKTGVVVMRDPGVQALQMARLGPDNPYALELAEAKEYHL